MKRIFAWILTAAALLGCLTGCGSSKAGTTKSGLYYEASGISPDAVLLTVDGWDVTADRFFYWLTTTCDYIQSYYAGVGSQVDWSEMSGGQSLSDYAMEQALQTTELYAIVESWAKQYGCELTDDDLAGIDTEWNSQVQQAGSEDAYLKQLANMGLNKTTAQLFSADYYLYSHLYDVYNTAGSKLHPAQTDLDTYAQEQGFLTVDDILISTGDVADGDADGLAAKRDRAQMVLGKLNASKDPLNDFAELANTYSDEAGRDDYPDGFTFAPGGGVMDAAFETAAKALQENQWSDLVQTDQGFYIILRKPLDSETVFADYFDHLLQEAADNAKVEFSDEYKSIQPADFYQKLTEARTRLGTSTAGSSSAGASGSTADSSDADASSSAAG